MRGNSQKQISSPNLLYKKQGISSKARKEKAEQMEMDILRTQNYQKDLSWSTFNIFSLLLRGLEQKRHNLFPDFNDWNPPENYHQCVGVSSGDLKKLIAMGIDSSSSQYEFSPKLKEEIDVVVRDCIQEEVIDPFFQMGNANAEKEFTLLSMEDQFPIMKRLKSKWQKKAEEEQEKIQRRRNIK